VLPLAIGHLEISGMPGRWGRIDVGADTASTLIDALATASASAPTGVRDLFETLDRVGVQTLNGDDPASIGFRLGSSGDWLVNVGDGRIRVQENFIDADCIIETTEQTLLAILRGDQNARTAMLAGKVKVLGDFALASRLSRMAAGRFEEEARMAA
jgi:putative sterol carrier protein